MSQEIPLKAAIKNSFWLCAVNRNFIWSTHLLQQTRCWETGGSSLTWHPSPKLKLLHGKALGSWNTALDHSFRLIVIITKESWCFSLGWHRSLCNFSWGNKRDGRLAKILLSVFASSCWFGRIKSTELFFVKSFSLLPSAAVQVQGNLWRIGLARLRRKQMWISPPLGQKKHPPSREYWQGEKEGTEN